MASTFSPTAIEKAADHLRFWLDIYQYLPDPNKNAKVAQIIKDLIHKISSSNVSGDLTHITKNLGRIRDFGFCTPELEEVIRKQTNLSMRTEKDNHVAVVDSPAAQSPPPDLPTSIPLHIYSVLGTRSVATSLLSTKRLLYSPSETAYKLHGDDGTCQDVDGNDMMIRLNCVQKVNHSMDYSLLVMALCCGWNQTGRVIEILCKEEEHGKALVEYLKKLGHVEISVGIYLSDVSGAFKQQGFAGK